MPDMNRKILDWSKVKKWVNDTFSLNTHNHDDRYSQLGHTHSDNIYSSMPDYSRPINIGAQEVWKSTTKECYNEPGDNGSVLGGCPYVLKLKSPCWVMLQPISGIVGSNTDDDVEWGLWWGTVREYVIAMNKTTDYSTRGALKRMTPANGFSNVIIGKNLFVYQNAQSSDVDGFNNMPLPMNGIDWWYRPFIGSGGSDNENWEYWDFKILPCIGTPKGTLLVELYQFTADNSKSSLLNSNPVFGTMDSSGNNVITYYNNNDISKATASMKRKRKGMIYAS